MIGNRNRKKTKGSRINSAVDKAALTGETVPLNASRGSKDKAGVSIVDVRGSPFGVDTDGSIELSRIKGVFSEKEEVEAEIRGDRLWLTMGKNSYWFRIRGNPDSDFDLKNLLDKWEKEPRATFEFDPTEMAQLARDADHVLLEAGRRKDGVWTVFATFYDGNHQFIRGVDLKAPWFGTESASLFAADYVSKWGRLGKKAKGTIGTNWPIVIEGEDRGVDYAYALAPRLPENAPFMEENRTDEEREWRENRSVKRLPRGRDIVATDRQHILDTFGNERRFVARVDEMQDNGSPDPSEAVYAMFTGRSNPDWMVRDYLITLLGQDYRGYGDEREVYGRLMARDGAAYYEEIVRRTRKNTKKGKNKTGGH